MGLTAGAERRMAAANTRARNVRAAARPRLATLIAPAGQRTRVGLGPWLRARYGIEQVQTISVSAVEWNGLAAERERPHAAERLRDRLSLALLGQPELLLVAGHPSVERRWPSWPRSPRHVERIVQRIKSWELPAEVVGVWMNERWDVDECVVEPEELQTRASGGVCPLRLAESAWENEGGRLKQGQAPSTRALKHRLKRRSRNVVCDNYKHAAGHAKASQGAPSRDPDRGLSRLRPRPSRLAHA
jgi:hypothetical protein